MNQEKLSIEVKIKKLDEQIAMLTKLKSQYAEKLNDLSAEEIIVPKPVDSVQSVNDHALLLKDYFRGRDDVYAKLWINNRTGKRGYSPVCKNEWVRSLCHKPAIKCSACPNQQFLPFDDIAISQHLDGRQVIGVYPMLKNESCYFLAIDFDGSSSLTTGKENWLEDIRAIMMICRGEGIPAAVERSRSGSGGHVWIFFSEEVPAILARKLGSSLITKTMARRYQIDMKSYDRIFPNQDTMPKGGYGNLIALPFQKEAMRRGNSVFIDDNGTPHPDQWAFLSSLGKMSFRDIEALVDEASKTGQIIAVRQSPVEENDEPWMRLPSGKRRFKVGISELPQALDAVLANRLYIKVEKGPSVLFNQLKHLSAFQNPEFYRKQKMRFSTHATPRVICCAEIVDDILANVDEGRFPLILTERREHLEILAERLQDKIDFLAVLYGGMGRKNQRKIFEQIKENNDNSRRAILATGSYIGEGFDEPRLDTLFLTMPSSFKGKIVQYAGRLHRYHQDKHDIRIYDYVDSRLPVLERMFKRRSKTYKLLGYEIKDQLGG